MTFDTVFQKIIKSGIMVYRGNGEEPQYIDTNQVIHKNGYLIFDVNYKIVMKNNGYVQHDVNHKTVKVFVSDANISYDKIQFADLHNSI
jgi:transcriptional regulator of NAD metabolism